MLFHFSEESSINQFIPRRYRSYPNSPPLVWAIDEEHAPLYSTPFSSQ
ncbi:DUF6886 family protein [Alicyclobacillus pomorum]